MSSTARFTAIMPIKAWASGKSRLHADPDVRRSLAQAISRDTLECVAACAAVARVVVVTGDASVHDVASAIGAVVVTEPPPSDDGLAAAIQAGLDWAGAHAADDAVVVVPADLPALTPSTLATALALAAEHRLAFVPDASGTGTTLLAAARPGSVPHRYGEGSAARHAAAGAHALTGVDPRVRRDVDTPDELAEARGLGVGPRTTRVLADQAG